MVARPFHLALLLTAACGASAGAFQSGAVADPVAPAATVEGLVPVDPRVADMGSLSTSLRVLQPDLRQPSGFDQVYRVPGADDLFMRAQGGLYAVFPRSTYVTTRNGVVPLVPPGTTFMIGAPSFLPELPRSVRALDLMLGTELANEPSPLRIETKVETAVGAAVTAQPPAGRNAAPAPKAQPIPPGRPTASSIVSDPGYRARRLRDLLHRAAAASRRGG